MTIRHNHVVTGEIFETKAGTEAIRFVLSLGFISLKFVVNIPEEGNTTAPVFISARIYGDHRYNQLGKEEVSREGGDCDV